MFTDYALSCFTTYRGVLVVKSRKKSLRLIALQVQSCEFD